MPKPGTLLLLTVALLLTTWAAQLGGLYVGVLQDRAYWSAPRGDSGGLLYVALGDSAAQGVGASRPAHGYVGLLADRLRTETGGPVRVVNLSVSGARVRDVLRDQLPALLALRPDVVTVAVGGNDVRGYDAARFDSDITALAAALPADALLADVPYFMHGHWEQDARSASSVLRARAGARQLTVVPLHAALERQGLRAMLTQFAPDLFHPNDRGHRVWADAFWEQVRRLPRVRAAVAARTPGPAQTARPGGAADMTFDPVAYRPPGAAWAAPAPTRRVRQMTTAVRHAGTTQLDAPKTGRHGLQDEPAACLGDLRAADVMSRDIVTLGAGATVEQALAVMRERGVRHLPVVLGGRFAGLVDDRLVALAHLADGAPDHRSVVALMTHYVPQVAPDAGLPRVARLVSDSGCDAVVVMDEAGELVGIVTASDLVRAVAELGVDR